MRKIISIWAMVFLITPACERTQYFTTFILMCAFIRHHLHEMQEEVDQHRHQHKRISISEAGTQPPFKEDYPAADCPPPPADDNDEAAPAPPSTPQPQAPAGDDDDDGDDDPDEPMV